MSERCNRVLGDFYFPGLLKWQTWDMAAGRDPDRESRAAFAAREVCVNHPDATSAVVAVLDAALGGARIGGI